MVSTAVRTFARGIPWNLFLLTLGCGLFALGVKAIAIPHMLISGGVFGTALLINYMTETLSPAVWNVLLNIPIFIAGWLFVGRRFVLYSLYGLAGKVFELKDCRVLQLFGQIKTEGGCSG